jgi:PIN domain nuclease of toxin-antitoxin system
VRGVLLDTHALVWFLADEPMADAALVAIAEAQEAQRLYISPVSAWEVAIALRKPDPKRRPNLGGEDAAVWFRRALTSVGARLAPVHQQVALEAARVPDVYGRGDPGDCFLIATARVKRVPIVTRDGAMRDLAADRRPGYLDVVVC